MANGVPSGIVPRARSDGELAERGKVLVDRDFGEAPGVGTQHIGARMQSRLHGPVGLLEVLRPEKLSLPPRDAMTTGHWFSKPE